MDWDCKFALAENIQVIELNISFFMEWEMTRSLSKKEI